MFVCVLLTGLELGSWSVKSDALPVEPPRHPATPPPSHSAIPDGGSLTLYFPSMHTLARYEAQNSFSSIIDVDLNKPKNIMT